MDGSMDGWNRRGDRDMSGWHGRYMVSGYYYALFMSLLFIVVVSDIELVEKKSVQIFYPEVFKSSQQQPLSIPI